MSEIDDGGFVYAHDSKQRLQNTAGITRRDQLADDIAVQMYLVLDELFHKDEITPDAFARYDESVPIEAYARADAMIKEGKK